MALVCAETARLSGLRRLCVGQHRHAGQLAGEYRLTDGFDRARARETPSPDERYTAAGNRRGERPHGGEAVIDGASFGRSRGQDGDSGPGCDHLSDGLERAAFEAVLHTIAGCTLDACAGLQHLIPETV